jgi:lipoyl(octanoyl) transferase
MAERATMGKASSTHDIAWEVSETLIPYTDALVRMGDIASSIADGSGPERIWLLEHPPLYTAGTSADPAELIDSRFPVYDAGRGGRYTYHGPGQRVGYVMINLKTRGQDVRCFVHALEQWVIAAVGDLGVPCWAVPGRVGIWTNDNGMEAKIGAIGVRVKRWVTFHGFAVNVTPDLSHFAGIVPCGLPEFPVTSLAKLGVPADMAQLDSALIRHFPQFLNALSEANKKA